MCVGVWVCGCMGVCGEYMCGVGLWVYMNFWLCGWYGCVGGMGSVGVYVVWVGGCMCGMGSVCVWGGGMYYVCG